MWRGHSARRAPAAPPDGRTHTARAVLLAGLYLTLGLMLVMLRRVMPYFIERGIGGISLRRRPWLDAALLPGFAALAGADLAGWRWPAAMLAAALLGSALPAAADASALYARHCASCHGADRLGGSGPALLPDSLGRLKPQQAERIIRDGRAATQMPGFGGTLDAAAISTLAGYLYTAPEQPVRWSEADMRASHRVLTPAAQLPPTPQHRADPLNLFVVVETGDHHASLLDGDRFEVLHRFPTRYALHGGPKFSPDGRFVYFASRDGWITQYDLYGFQPVAEIRAGINTRNLALSADGKVVAVGNYLPRSLVFLDANGLQPLATLPVRGDGADSRVSAVYQAAPRGSFIAALKDIPEVWEIRQDDPGFTPRRLPLDRIMDDFQFDPDYKLLIGAPREGGRAIVLDLDSGRAVAELPVPGLPHLNAGTTWLRDDRRLLATPNLKQGRISVLDMQDWQVLRDIETSGPGFFMRSHENAPHVWSDAMLGPQRDRLHLLDKNTLEIAATLIPEPGKTAAHVEFDRDGRHALVSLWEDDGALIVYDARTLQEIKRLPMKKPSGKYNVHNKITRSEGTSH